MIFKVTASSIYGEGVDIFNAATRHSEDIDIYKLMLECNKLI